MLLLLVIFAGNLAFVTVNKAVLDDVEAVAEWRIDKDPGDDDLGAEPEMPALLALFRQSEDVVADLGTVPLKPHLVTEVQFSAQATRAPPSAALA